MPQITQQKMARALGVGQSTLSGIFTGASPCGKRTAKKIASLTGHEWHRLMAMEGANIKEIITTALEAKTPEAA